MSRFEEHKQAKANVEQETLDFITHFATFKLAIPLMVALFLILHVLQA